MKCGHVTPCGKNLLRSRVRLAVFGEPQLCRSCGKPLEFARSWQRVVVLLQLWCLILALFLLPDWHGISKSVFAAATIALLQFGYWRFAPVRIQSPDLILRRNRWYAILAVILLMFAGVFSVLMWQSTR